MEILGIGPLELLFILLIALIAVGPRDLGKAARSTGRLLNQLYKSEAWKNLSEASRSIRTLPNRLAREAALEELAQVKREVEEGVTTGMDQLKDINLEPEQPGIDQPKESDLTPDQPKLDTSKNTDPASSQTDNSPEGSYPEEY